MVTSLRVDRIEQITFYGQGDLAQAKATSNFIVVASVSSSELPRSVDKVLDNGLAQNITADRN